MSKKEISEREERFEMVVPDGEVNPAQPVHEDHFAGVSTVDAEREAARMRIPDDFDAEWPECWALARAAGMTDYTLRRLAIDFQTTTPEAWRENLLARLKVEGERPKEAPRQALPHVANLGLTLSQREQSLESELALLWPEWRVGVMDELIELLQKRKKDTRYSAQYREGSRTW